MNERKTIYLCLAHMSEDGMEQKYVKEAFDTNWVVPMGPNVNAFENELEKIENKKQKLVDMCLSGDIETSDYRKACERLKSEYETISENTFTTPSKTDTILVRLESMDLIMLPS